MIMRCVAGRGAVDFGERERERKKERESMSPRGAVDLGERENILIYREHIIYSYYDDHEMRRAAQWTSAPTPSRSASPSPSPSPHGLEFIRFA